LTQGKSQLSFAGGRKEQKPTEAHGPRVKGEKNNITGLVGKERKNRGKKEDLACSARREKVERTGMQEGTSPPSCYVRGAAFPKRKEKRKRTWPRVKKVKRGRSSP